MTIAEASASFEAFRAKVTAAEGDIAALSNLMEDAVEMAVEARKAAPRIILARCRVTAPELQAALSLKFAVEAYQRATEAHG